MKTIGILGCGWIGQSLAEELIQNNYKVKGTTTTLSKLNTLEDMGIKPYHINLYEKEIDYLDYFMQDLDLLIITIPPLLDEKSPSYAANFKLLLPYLHKHKIDKVIMYSSVSVYAPSSKLITEDSLCFNDNFTAKQLTEAENTLLNDPYVNACILRLGGLFGDDRHPVNYICKQKELSNPELPIHMIHLFDILAITKAIIAKDFQTNCIFNIVSDKYKSRKHYYMLMAEQLNVTLPKDGKTDQTLYKKINAEKVKNFTGLEYKY